MKSQKGFIQIPFFGESQDGSFHYMGTILKNQVIVFFA